MRQIETATTVHRIATATPRAPTEAVAVDGIPDDRLRALIVHLFDTLGLRRGGAARAHILPEGAPKIVPRLALVFDETREQLAPFARLSSSTFIAESSL